MPGVVGDPAAVEAAADHLARAATRLVEVRDAVALRRRVIGEAWLGSASLVAITAVEGATGGTAVLADVSGGVVAPLRVFAAELRRAQLATEAFQATDVSGSRIVLRRDPSMPGGYRIQSSFPNP